MGAAAVCVAVWAFGKMENALFLAVVAAIDCAVSWDVGSAGVAGGVGVVVFADAGLGFGVVGGLLFSYYFKFGSPSQKSSELITSNERIFSRLIGARLSRRWKQG